jgi:hypothetical protein
MIVAFLCTLACVSAVVSVCAVIITGSVLLMADVLAHD